MTDESTSSPKTPQLVQADQPGALRRSHQVKVTLNRLELEFLDEIVAHMGSDRSSALRHLLRMASGDALKEVDSNPEHERQPAPQSTTKITRVDLNTLYSNNEKKATVVIHEPQEFDDVTAALEDLSKGDIITVNLCMMQPEHAQRFVDFVAGGTYTVKGNQERIGESVFLFTPKEVTVTKGGKSSEGTSRQKQPGNRMLMDGSKSDKTKESEEVALNP